jgi:hypothetical protein
MAKEPRENRVPIMMSDAEMGAIDNWRFDNHVATRSDAIRRLAFNGLALAGRADLLLWLHQRARESIVRAVEGQNALLDTGPPIDALALLHYFMRVDQALDDAFSLASEALDLATTSGAVSNEEGATLSEQLRAALNSIKERKKYPETRHPGTGRTTTEFLESPEGQEFSRQLAEKRDADLAARQAARENIEPMPRGPAVSAAAKSARKAKPK